MHKVAGGLGGTLLVLWVILTVVSGSNAPISTRYLHDWFISRIAWSPLFGLFCGVMLGIYLGGSIRYRPKEPDINRDTRQRFLMWLGFLFFTSILLLVIDAIFLYDFRVRVSVLNAITSVLLNWRALVVCLTFLLSITLICAVYLRFWRGGTLPMRYAMWPVAPKGSE